MLKIEAVQPVPSEAATMPYAPAVSVETPAELIFISGATASPLYHKHPHVPEQHVQYVPYTTCKMVCKEHVCCVPHTTCRMEQYCEKRRVCRQIPICVPVCEDPCCGTPRVYSSPAPLLDSTGPAPAPLPQVIEKE